MDLLTKIMKQHPPALPYLFFTEMWERFGFYIIQSLLIFYLINKLGFTDTNSYAILGAFTALAYMLSWVGGFFADEILGFKRTIYLGAILLIIGYSLLAVPYHTILFYALAIIVTGTGFLKPNISSLLGSLYEQRNPRREAGFTIFYIGIYLGIVLATTTSGFIQEKFGWHITFATAAIGLIIGLLTFYASNKLLADHGLPPKSSSKIINLLKNPIILFLIILIQIYLIRLLMEHERIATGLLIISGSLLLLIFFIRAFFFEWRIRNKLLALLVLFIFSILFWAVYFQMFFSINLFIERAVNRTCCGILIPPVFFIAIQACAVIVFGIFLAYLWQMLAQQGRNPSIPFKFTLALFIISAAFFVLVFGIKMSGYQLVNPSWIACAYVLIAIAELLLSAIGLSAVTVLAPQHLIGTLMGVWFVSLGLGGELAGIFAKQASLPSGILSLQFINQHYAAAFENYALYAILVGGIALLLTPFLQLMVKGKEINKQTLFYKPQKRENNSSKPRKKV